MEAKGSKERQDLIKSLSSISNFKDDIDNAVYSFSVLCISSLYKIDNPKDLIGKESSVRALKMQDPRACLYYILWLNTGRSFTELNELCPICDSSNICRLVNRVKIMLKRENSDMAINIRNIQGRVESFKEQVKTEWTKK